MKNTVDLPHEIYTKYLKEINGIPFSLRDVEIMASLFLSENTKQSPDVISLVEKEDKDCIKFTGKIAESTIYTHLGRIYEKLKEPLKAKTIALPNKSKNSDNIRCMIEQSPSFLFFNQYCTALRLENLFLKHLENIFKKYTAETKKTDLGTCIMYVEDLDLRSMPWFYKKLACFLNNRKAEHEPKIITTLIKKGEWWKNKLKDETYVLCVVPEHSKFFTRKSTSETDKLIDQLLKKNHQHTGRILFLLDNWVNKNTVPQFIKDVGFIHINTGESYYACTFKILKGLFPSIALDHEIEAFQEESNKFKKDEAPLEGSSYLKKKWFILSIVLFVGISFSLFALIHYVQPEIIARTDIKLPTDSFLLKRTNILQQMDMKLTSTNDIQTIALVGVVGIGGAGKTTLARVYAKSQQAAIVWEINAETRTSSMDSFMNFATALAKTKESKDEITFIKSIQDEREKEKQLMLFIKYHLKKHSNWLLIYDNVDSLAVIDDFFPHDAQNWGVGKIIITTRDSNIVSSSYIGEQNVIHIDQLSPEESLTLLSKILYQKESKKLSQEEKERMRVFLVKIPPFPLDVSVAAHYIKNASLTFDQYIERITKHTKNFDKREQKFLKEISDYTQTRYGLITLSLTKLIEANPEYKELLFLICFLDSQNIPLDLLTSYKNPILIDNFIRDLKKYSLITSQSGSNQKNFVSVFSLHRSMQMLTQKFLVDQLPSEKQKELFDTYIHIVKSYYEKHIYTEYPMIPVLIPHLEAFLQKTKSTKNKEGDKEKWTQTILYMIGNAYYHGSRNFIKEKECFEEVYRIQEKRSYLSNLEFASMLKLLTYVCLELEFTKDSIVYAEKALKLCDKIPKSDLLASSILKVTGFAYLHENNFEKSQFYFKEALLRIAHVDFDVRKESEASIYSYLGLLYSLTYVNGEKMHEGLGYAHKALDMIDGTRLYYKTSKPKTKLSSRIVEHKVNLGDIYCHLGRYQEAYDLYFKDVEFITNNSLDSCTHTISKIITKVGLGEIYLRTNQLEMAKDSLTVSFKETEQLIAKNNGFTLKLATFRAEAYVRLGEFDKAYADCTLAFKQKKENAHNYAKTLLLMAYYHAAVIKYKQGDYKESWKHFNEFFENAKPLYKLILSEQKYQKLEEVKAFEVPAYQNDFPLKSMKQCFNQSTAIFSAMYGKHHPFISDYVMIHDRNTFIPK